MVRSWVTVSILALALTHVSASQNKDPAASGAWVAEPAEGATSASAFAVIENPGMYDVYVVGVTCDAAGSAEIADGPPDSAKTLDSLTVPAYGQTELKAGGVHIRLKDLKRPLKAGESIELTLSLDNGATVKVSAPVKKG